MISIETDFGDISKWADDIAKKQIPFAMAKALTDTAAQIGKAAALQAKATMEIKAPWSAKHYKAKKGGQISPGAAFFSIPAIKTREIAKMFAVAGTIGWQVAQQIDNAKTIRRPLKSKYLWIPLQKELRHRHGKRKKNISQLGKKGSKVFTRIIDGKRMVIAREGNSRYPIKPLYILVPEQDIKPQYDFEKLAERRAQKYFSFFFDRAMKQAIKTAK